MDFCTEFVDGWWSWEPLRRSCVWCGPSAPYTRPTQCLSRPPSFHKLGADIYIYTHTQQMSILSFPRPQQISQYVPTDADFLWYKLETHRHMINGTPLNRHTPRIGTYMLDSLHSCLVNSTKTANKTALNWYVS